MTSTEGREPVRARRAMAVAQEPFATEVGVAVLKTGGNAIDAAVAIGFALAVTHPFAGNIGGGGFLLARFADGRTTFIDFREAAPLQASRNMYLDEHGNMTRDSLEGWRASGVPGTVRGLELAHSKYGRRRWRDVVQPAVDLAARGFTVSHALHRSLTGDSATRLLSAFPESKRIFLKDGDPYEVGATLRQPELARTLERIAKQGAKDFYEGETARTLAAEMKRHGGLITLEDLRQYRAVERKPLEGTYRNYRIITAPPPSSGGIGVLQMLGMLESSHYARRGPEAATTIHYMTEVMRRYYADRSEHLADPDFHTVPVQALLEPKYIRERASSIDPQQATPSDQIGPGSFPRPERTETTHYNIVDEQGNAVAVTYTLNGGYGSGVTVPGLGFLLNNEMDDFSAKPGEPNLFGLIQGEANAIAPRKRPLSSMTPTIVLRDGQLDMLLGAPGGSRIITAVLQVFLNVVDFGMNLQDAIDAPRFHHQWKPDRIEFERGFSPDTLELLRQKGHHIDALRYVVVARVEGIRIRDGWLEGGSDGRGDGKAAGY
jgi:gamma-glutamyltranspeptidase / glutathione hydrolase